MPKWLKYIAVCVMVAMFGVAVCSKMPFLETWFIEDKGLPSRCIQANSEKTRAVELVKSPALLNEGFHGITREILKVDRIH
jgi:hypothetical protein